MEDMKENITWHKGPRIAISVTFSTLYHCTKPKTMSLFDSYLVIVIWDLQVLDEIFVTQMQSLLGTSLKEENLEAPRSMMELRSILL